MSYYLIQGETLTAIADKVRSKLADEILRTPEEMPAAVDEVYEKAQRDVLLNYAHANNASFNLVFSEAHWTDETYKLTEKDTLIAGKNQSCNQMYHNSRITDTKATIDISEAVQTYALFSSRMVTVRKVIVSSNNKLKGAFLGCNSLVYVTIEGTIASDFDISSATKLSKASITNIFGCLSTETSGLTVTFSKEAIDNALTNTEWDDLIYSHPNWSIATI